MTDYTELIRSLRNCSNNRCTPCDCGWFNKYQVDESCKEIIMWKAAAAIEALETEIRESMQKCAECGDANMPKRGEWIYHPKDAIEMMFTLPKCSICGHESSDALNYCPNCGAKMEVQDGKRCD